MTEIAGIFAFLGLGAVVIAAIVWGITATCRLLAKCPKHLGWHRFTACVWTLITGIQTAVLVTAPKPWGVVGCLILLASGSVWLMSWAQFAERCRVETRVQEKRPLLARLYVQTLWGPLALWAAIMGINYASQLCFESAVEKKDLPTAFFLRECRLGDPGSFRLSNLLEEAIGNQDADAVANYLAAGASSGGYHCWGAYYPDNSNGLDMAVQQDNTMITELLINYMQSADNTVELNSSQLLFKAIAANKPNQVRTLLRHNIDRNVCNYNGKRPIEVAEKLGHKEIVAILKQRNP